MAITNTSPNTKTISEPWETESDPFNYTRAGYLGKHRAEMLTNELLLKDTVGKAKLRSGTLPPKDFIYGENYRSPWTAGHALRNWEGTFPTAKEKKKVVEDKLPTDFLQLNRGALSAGVLSSKEVTLFRKLKRRIKFKRASLNPEDVHKALERPLPKSFPFDHNFGIVHIYGPPFVDTLRHVPQKQWLLSRKKQDHEEKHVKPDFTIVKPNRASLLRPLHVAAGVEEVPWRIPRYVNDVEPHLSTFRCEKVKAASYLAGQLDAQGRQGQRGQGIERLHYHDQSLPPLKVQPKCPPGVGPKAWIVCD